MNVFGVEPFSLIPGWTGERLTAVLGKINQLIFGLDGGGGGGGGGREERG